MGSGVSMPRIEERDRCTRAALAVAAVIEANVPNRLDDCE